MDAPTPNKLTECARIYMFIDHENTNFLIITCLFCNKEYCEWAEFYNHLQGAHLEKFRLRQSTKSNVEVDIIDVKTVGLVERYKLKEHIVMENQYLEEFSDSDKMDVIIEEPLKTVFNNTINHTFLEEHTTETLDDFNEDKMNFQKKLVSGGDFESNKSAKPVKTCFFRLYTTKSTTMLKFIELLRQHPCQWGYKYLKFSQKERRINDTLHLTKQLNKYCNLNITPQGTRASVLSLMRWFEREYIRFLSCQQNNLQFVCTYNEYFKKLLEFLPHQHLKPMICNECSKRFKSEHLLMSHKHRYHNGQVPLRCRYCGHGFIHKSSHKMHENRHIKIHLWPCKMCLYQAASKSDYIKHLATHSPKQPHKCEICGLSYKTTTNLNVHMKSHSLPRYECEFCKKKFHEKYRYKRHIWLHEEQEIPEKSIDNFTCPICGRRFASNKTLVKHQLVHIRENYKVVGQMTVCQKSIDLIVFYCDFCSLEFDHKEAFKTHMNLKHNVNY